MPGLRPDYREWLRIQLAIDTPRSQWQTWADIGQQPDYPMPAAGLQPSWNLQITNTTLNQVINNAANRVTVECRVVNPISWSDINVAATTANGPQTFKLSAVPGFSNRSAVRLRRAFWYDTTSYTPLQPVNLSQLDTQMTDYLNVGPGVPTQVAIEGDTVYLMPGAQTAGVLRMTIGSGVLAPLSDEEGYDGIPAVYDDQVNYVALVEIASIPTVDAEMRARAAAFAPLAQQAIANLTGWFDNQSNDEFIGSADFKTNIIRFPMRA